MTDGVGKPDYRPLCQRLWHLHSPPLPRSPSTHYPPITGPGGRGWGPAGIAREGAGTLGAPLSPRFPAGSPAGRRWAQLKGGKAGASCLPERGVLAVPGLSCPLGHSSGLAQNPGGRRESMPPTPWAPGDHPSLQGPWSRGLGAACLACSHPSVQACGVRGHRLPRPAGPSVSSGPRLLLPSPGAFLPEAGRRLRGAWPAPALRSGGHLEATLTAPHVPASVPDGPIC